jgi:hypothetical protein
MASLESEKSETLLSLNAFNNPAEVSGVDAWVKLVIHIMYIIKGTYPSNPDIGIGIQLLDYQFMDNVIDSLPTDILNQVRKYLPDVPLESVNATTEDINGKKVLEIVLVFNDDGTQTPVVIASTTSSSALDFEVSM